MRRMVRWSIAAAVVLSGAGLVLADDLNPPLWRGDADSTCQLWGFATNDPNDVVADSYTNAYGVPAADITGTWMDSYLDRSGVWILSGLIDATIPNTPPHLEKPKTIWVQVTWTPDVTGMSPVVKVLENAYDPEVIGTLVTQQDLSGDWKHSTYEIVEPNNPDWEIVRVSGCVAVDQLVIDTIPEPVTGVLLVLGGAALLARRRAG